MSIFDVMRNTIMAGFGVQERVKEFIDELVKKGELSESQGAKLVKEWSEKVEKNTEDISKSMNEIVAKTIEKMRLASREDIDKLNEKIDALAAKFSKTEGVKGEGQETK